MTIKERMGRKASSQDSGVNSKETLKGDGAARSVAPMI